MAPRLGVDRTSQLDRPDPWTPRLRWRDQTTIRQHLSWELRLACDLLTAGRIRPATVVALLGQHVGPDGRSLRVRDRKHRHTLSVPAFLRAELALLATRGERALVLFPGRTRGGTLCVTALRHCVHSAAEEALGEQRDLRDLSDLAASVLVPTSGNPGGRTAALTRLASRWVSADAAVLPAGAMARHDLEGETGS